MKARIITGYQASNSHSRRHLFRTRLILAVADSRLTNAVNIYLDYRVITYFMVRLKPVPRFFPIAAVTRRIAARSLIDVISQSKFLRLFFPLIFPSAASRVYGELIAEKC